MTRTNYMNNLMISTYPQVAVEAVIKGFAGSWERVIARRLEADVKRDVSEAVVICESVGNDYMKAAYLITSSKTESHVNQ